MANTQQRIDTFVRSHYPAAAAVESRTLVPAVFILAQAALESGWGKAAPGNALFGVKDRDGINGNEQLLTTTEYSRRRDLKFPEIISVTPVVIGGVRMYRYRIRDYFRAYESVEECFADHARLLRTRRYIGALEVRDDVFEYARRIAAAGYATDPNYATKLASVIRRIQGVIKRLSLK